MEQSFVVWAVLFDGATKTSGPPDVKDLCVLRESQWQLKVDSEETKKTPQKATIDTKTSNVAPTMDPVTTGLTAKEFVDSHEPLRDVGTETVILK
jgi:hypothetical protein